MALVLACFWVISLRRAILLSYLVLWAARFEVPGLVDLGKSYNAAMGGSTGVLIRGRAQPLGRSRLVSNARAHFG